MTTVIFLSKIVLIFPDWQEECQKKKAVHYQFGNDGAILITDNIRHQRWRWYVLRRSYSYNTRAAWQGTWLALTPLPLLLASERGAAAGSAARRHRHGHSRHCRRGAALSPPQAGAAARGVFSLWFVCDRPAVSAGQSLCGAARFGCDGAFRICTAGSAAEPAAGSGVL